MECTGPVIWVNPDELSIHDPDFYDEIYVTESKRRTSHYDVFCKGIDFDGACFYTSLPVVAILFNQGRSWGSKQFNI